MDMGKSLFPHLRAAALSDIGRKRKNNEDSFGSFPQYGVWCVADGMGGGDDGEVASEAVVKSIDAYLASLPALASGAYAGSDVAKGLSRALGDASAWIFKYARKNNLKGCGSTFVGVVFDATNPGAALALHVGDSRLYRLSGKDLKQITKDHSVAEMMGAKSESDLNPMFRGMILRAVGIESSVDVEVTPFSVKKGDCILVCSDGLTRMVPDKRIAEIVNKSGDDVDAAAKRLVAAANDAGGIDNITVELVQVGELPPSESQVRVPDEQGSSSSSFTFKTLDREVGGVGLSRVLKWLLAAGGVCALAAFVAAVAMSFTKDRDVPAPRHEIEMSSKGEPQSERKPPAVEAGARHETVAQTEEPEQPAAAPSPVAPQASEPMKVEAPRPPMAEDAERLEAEKMLKAERERRKRDEEAAAQVESERRTVAQGLAAMFGSDDYDAFFGFLKTAFGRSALLGLQKRGKDLYTRRNDVDVCEAAAEYVKELQALAAKIAGGCGAAGAPGEMRADLKRKCDAVVSGSPSDVCTQRACIDLVAFVHKIMVKADGKPR